MSDSLQPRGLYNPWNSPGQNTGVGCLSLLQGIFPTQGLNPGLLHCGWILYQLSHKGSPYMGLNCSMQNPFFFLRSRREEAYFIYILFISLFLAVLGLHCCTGFSLAVASRGYSLSSCSARASRIMRDL